MGENSLLLIYSFTLLLIYSFTLLLIYLKAAAGPTALSPRTVRD
jgi:hypothetical protein